jgi:hypothetical protein
VELSNSPRYFIDVAERDYGNPAVLEGYEGRCGSDPATIL